MKREITQAGAAGAASVGAGTAMTAAAVSACCVPIIGPALISLLGAGGAVWAAGLAPYSPFLLAGSFLLLAGSFWSVYRPRRACDHGIGETDATVQAPLWLRAVLWGSALVWVLALVVNLIFRI